jgi:hypothetical protein
MQEGGVPRYFSLGVSGLVAIMAAHREAAEQGEFPGLVAASMRRFTTASETRPGAERTLTADGAGPRPRPGNPHYVSGAMRREVFRLGDPDP